MHNARRHWGKSHRVPCILLVAALGGGLPYGSRAANSVDFKPVPGHSYVALVDPKRPVSGHMVVGMSFGRGVYGPLLEAYLPNPSAKGTKLRIDIDSPDGRFLGTGLFVSDAPKKGWNTIELLPESSGSIVKPSDHDSSELSISVTLVSGVPQWQNKLVPVRWAQAPRSSGDSPLLRLFINSRRAEKVMVSGADGAFPGVCRRVTARSVRRFDTICELDLPRAQPGSDRRSVTVTRVDGFDSEPQTLDILYSDR